MMNIEMKLQFHTPEEIEKMDLDYENMGNCESTELELFGKRIKGKILCISRECSTDPHFHNYEGMWSNMLLNYEFEGKIVDEHQKQYDNMEMSDEYYKNCVLLLSSFHDGLTILQWKRKFKFEQNVVVPEMVWDDMTFFMLNHGVINCVKGFYRWNKSYYSDYLRECNLCPEYCEEHINYFKKYTSIY